MRVFLTGGTGLIGSHVAARLRDRGDDVVALVRSTSQTSHLVEIGCQPVVGDILDDPGVTAARIRGCDAVVHAAAKVFERGGRGAFARLNVGGTERVLEAAGRAAPRVVHVSSVAVYAGLPADRPLTEDRWTEADPDRQSPYAASKHLSERAAWRWHGAGDVRLTTVRPSVVYGERDRAATPIFVRYARLPVIPLVGGGRTTLPVVYAGNVARAIVAALDRDASIGRAYNLARDVPVTARDLARWLARDLGRRARLVSVPAGPARSAAAAIDMVSRLVPWAGQTDARRAVRSLSRDNPYLSSRARLELGWTGLIPHEEGVRRTMEWWRSRTD
jgi:nucleoside-diphosphate-sugar epimerase